MNWMKDRAKRLLGDKTARRTLGVATALYVLGALVPTLTLFVEYGRADAEVIAKTYAHFFIYPPMFVGIVLYLAVAPVRFLASLPRRERNRLWIALLCFLALVSVVEFTGTPAVFELTPEALTQPRFTDDNDRPVSLLDHFKAPREDNRDKFDIFIRLGNSSPGNWSYTKWSYGPAFVILSGLYLFIFLMVASVYRLHGSGPYCETIDRESLIERLFLLVFFSTIWIVFRFAFAYQELEIYDIAVRKFRSIVLVGLENYLIAFIFLLEFILLAIMLFRKHQEIVKLIFGLVYASGFLTVTLDPEISGAFLNRDTSARTYVIIFIFCILFVYPFSSLAPAGNPLPGRRRRRTG